MTMWDWLNRVGPGWPNARGWYAVALFAQACAILLMIAVYPQVTTDEFFKSLATAIVVTGWVGFAVAGRDNRVERDQVGQGQQLAADLLQHIRQLESRALPQSIVIDTAGAVPPVNPLS